MANFAQLPDLPSEDESDEDFAPESADEEGKPAVSKKTTSRKRSRNLFVNSIGDQPAVVAPEQTHAVEELEVEEEDKPFPSAAQQQKKTKVDELWSRLQQQNKVKSTSWQGLASVCRPAGSQNTKTTKDTYWMQQLGLGKNGERAAPPTKGKVHVSKQSTAAAAAALQSAKGTATRSVVQPTGPVVSETVRFAGKEIKVKAVKAEAEQDTNKAGLDAVLASLQATKKVNVLDKSRMDWGEFKTSNAEVEDELEAHKRSGDQYLEKKEFLHRADVSEYERVRDQRLAGDIRTRDRS